MFRDVDYDDVDASKLISAHELFGKLLSKTLRGTSDQNICAVFDCESFLWACPEEPLNGIVDEHHSYDKKSRVVVHELLYLSW